MRKINKKGVMGLGTAQAFLIGLLALVIVGVLTLIVLDSLQTTSVGTAATSNIINNTSSGLNTFFTNVPTWLTLLAVVVIILIIAAVIFVINKFGRGSGSL